MPEVGPPGSRLSAALKLARFRLSDVGQERRLSALPGLRLVSRNRTDRRGAHNMTRGANNRIAEGVFDRRFDQRKHL